MCGIIGIASNKPVSVNIINSLKNWNTEDMTLWNSDFKSNFINEKMLRKSGRIRKIL